MTQRAEVWLAWFLFGLSLVGWPISALTFAKNEPPTVLGLSWFAITLTALDFLKNARAHRDQPDKKDE